MNFKDVDMNEKKIVTELTTFLFLFLGLFLLIQHTQFEFSLEGNFFSLKSGWIFRDNFLLEKVFHKGGVKFIILCLLFLIISYFVTIKNQEKKKINRYLLFNIMAILMTLIFVNLLKKLSTSPCPWYVQQFGGNFNTPSILEIFSPALPHFNCFPAGHSSGGFAFISLYFGYNFVYEKRRPVLLIPGIILGTTFGITQQLRGAHFISHDIATICISLLSSLITLFILKKRDTPYEK